MKTEKMQVFSVDYFNKVVGDHEIQENKKHKMVHVTAIKGENALAQLVIQTTDERISYFVNVFDLHDQKGRILQRKNVGIFHQKHIQVKKPSKNRTMIGQFSDPLIPLEVARKSGESVVLNGLYQAVLLDIHVPSEIESSTYKGKIEINMGGILHHMDLVVEVLDLALEKDTSFVSSINLGSDGIYMAEGTYFPEDYRLYSESLMSFKLSPDKIIQYLNIPYVTNDDFINQLRIYKSNPKYQFLTVVIPMHESDDGFNTYRFKQLLYDLVVASFKDRTNYLEHAMTAFKYTKNEKLNEIYEQVKAEVILQANQTIEPSLLLRNVLKSLTNLKNYSEISYPEVMSKQIEHYPQYQQIVDQDERRKLASFNGNKWFYQSGLSDNLLSYHALFIDAEPIEIYQFIWHGMMHDKVGLFLYESTMSYALTWDNASKVNHRIPIDDAYEVSMKNQINNGDGFLFYPGKKYGLKSPITSLRLYYIKDAITDYQLIEKYKKLAIKHQLNALDLLEKLYKKVMETSDYINEVRKPLMSAINALSKDIK